MEINKILITPSLAKQYLEANTKNRNTKQIVISRYANDMINGNWKEDTFEFIKISKSGVVLDGQHRLLAVIKANVSINFHIAKGLDDGIFDVLDTGTTRNAGDVFHINKIKNATSLPSMIQLYEILKGKKYNHIGAAYAAYRKTNSDLLKLYQERSLFWDTVARKSTPWYNSFSKVMSPQLIGGMYAYFYDLSPEDAERFMNQLCTGLDIENNTISLLRAKLIQDKLSVKKITIEVRNSLIVKTWNHFRNGIVVTQLRYDALKEPLQIAI